MSYLVQVAPTSHHGWMEARIHRPLGADVVAMEALSPEGDVRGMIAFEWWSEGAVGVHVAADAPAVLRHADRVLDFALSRLRPTLWALVEEGGRSHRLAARLGFKVAGVVPDGYSVGRDLVLLVLTKATRTKARRE